MGLLQEGPGTAQPPAPRGGTDGGVFPLLPSASQERLTVQSLRGGDTHIKHLLPVAVNAGSRPPLPPALEQRASQAVPTARDKGRPRAGWQEGSRPGPPSCGRTPWPPSPTLAPSPGSPPASPGHLPLDHAAMGLTSCRKTLCLPCSGRGWVCSSLAVGLGGTPRPAPVICPGEGTQWGCGPTCGGIGGHADALAADEGVQGPLFPWRRSAAEPGGAARSGHSAGRVL